MKIDEELDDVPFTEEELSQLKGLNSDFWRSEDYSQHALFRDELPTDISEDATLTALQLLSDEKLTSGADLLEHWRGVGNQLYKDSLAFEKLNNMDLKKRRLRDAISAYTKAARAEGGESLDELRSVTHANRALCFFKLGQYAECVEDAKIAIVKNSHNIKGYFHAARASLALGLHKRALSFVDEAYKHNSESDCSSALASLRSQLVDILAARKAAAQQRVSESKKANEILMRVLAVRKIVWKETNPYNAPLGMPRITQKNLIAWPILILIDELGVSEALDSVEESATVGEILTGFFTQTFAWNACQSYTATNVIPSIWIGDKDDTYLDLNDPQEPLHKILGRCSIIHRYLVMKLRTQTF